MEYHSKPMGNSLIVCDDIIEDKLTGKKTLIGMFTKIHTIHFPTTHPKLNIFISFDNAKGKYKFKVKIVGEKNGNVIVEAKGNITVKSPIDMTDLNIVFMNVMFPEEDIYNIEFFCNEELVLQRRFTVEKIKKGEKQ